MVIYFTKHSNISNQVITFLLTALSRATILWISSTVSQLDQRNYQCWHFITISSLRQNSERLLYLAQPLSL